MPVDFLAFSFSEIPEALPVIFSLILINGLLSVDNALGIAAMASHLPGRQKVLALRVGILGAYICQGFALALASQIANTPWVMWCGSAYLIYLMSQHFTGAGDEDDDGLPDFTNKRGFFATVVAIEIMDISLSVDNVVAAAALDRRLWVLCTGVFIGILALRFVAGYCIKLIEKYPILAHTAFLLIGFIGFILVGELAYEAAYGKRPHLPSWQKFIGIIVILCFTLWYAKSPRLQAFFRPINAAARLPMKAVAMMVGGAIALLLSPIRLIARLFRKPAAAGGPPGITGSEL